ncbi:MAG: hypothetical protein K6F72_02565 [Bacteroidales bacterium]|nr:hypothetical protein [Bacteroidales bacterium]
MMRPILSREQYMKLRGNKRQQSIVRAVRMGDASQKMKLVQMNYSCLPNADGTLKGSTRMSTTIGMDIDHIGAEEMEAVKERILEKKEELGLLMLEKSARGQGYHVVFRRRAELTQEENLRWASELLGVEFDKGAKDITRVFFATTASEEDLIFLDDEIFEVKEANTKASEANTNRTDGTNGHTPSPLRGTSPNLGGELAGAVPPTESADTVLVRQEFPREYKGIAYKDIIAKYWEMFNDGKEPQEGDRDTLTYQLACDLRHICGRNAQWLDQVIPCYDGFPLEEKRKKIESALGAKSEGMPYRLKQVLAALKSQSAIKACGGTLTTPPSMPKKLPPLVRLLTSNVPDFYKPAVASAVFPALAAHLHGVKFRYWDNVEHEATFMNVLIGRQSIGKGTIKKPIEFIMEDIRQRDIPNRQREAEWKQKNPGAKQKKDPRPTDICIQMLIDNLTDAVFNQRIVDANNNGERFIYTIVDEIDALKKVTSKGSVDEVGLLIRKAFDNSMAGQERVGADSVSGIAPLRWNFNASTTPPNARKFFYKMVNDGTVSRLDVATIIRDDDSDDEAPILGIYDHRFAAEMKPYIDRLEACNGLIECPQARKLSLEMKKENSDAAKLYDSEAYRVFSYRANVIAWLKGMVLYVAHGYKWSKEIADFVRWSQQYNLWCKMLYFGQQLEKELREEVEIQRQSGPQNLLELLPDEFSKEQYQLMRQSQGRTGNGDGTLRSWACRGYIAADAASGRYVKTEEYLRKFKGLRV